MQICLPNNLKVFHYIEMAYYVEEPFLEEARSTYSLDLSVYT
jgi:hypothetical protein